MARVALVTGGTRGIGEAISVALKEAGYKVAANYAGNDEAASKFKEKTGIAVYKWDVADFEACRDGIAKVEADLGPIDVLVNNAGITRDTTLHRMKPEQWRDVIRTNLDSLFNMTRGVIEGMRERNFGRIVSISSVVGVTGNPGQANYAASKAAVIGMSKSLAQEVASRGITVNCIAPGFIATAMTEVLTDEQKARIAQQIPAGRMGTAEEIAAAALFLAFAWLELVPAGSGEPVILGLAALVYTALLVAVMARIGRETGLAGFDLFTPYNRLFSSISPLGRRPDGRIVWRGWLRALTVLPAWPGLAAFEGSPSRAGGQLSDASGTVSASASGSQASPSRSESRSS